jgi:hypothetical protein
LAKAATIFRIFRLTDQGDGSEENLLEINNSKINCGNHPVFRSFAQSISIMWRGVNLKVGLTLCLEIKEIQAGAVSNKHQPGWAGLLLVFSGRDQVKQKNNGSLTA